MYIEVMTFEGPRTDAEVAASERAGRDRLDPLIQAHPGLSADLLGGLRALGPDGAECMLVFARDAATLDELGRVVMSSELLPGEDPALLPGPTRIERYDVAATFGPLADYLAGVVR